MHSHAINVSRSHGLPSPARTPRAVGSFRPTLAEEPTRVTVLFGAMALLMFLVLIMSAFAVLEPERPLTPAEIREQAGYCRAHGLQPLYFTNGQDTRIRSVQCADRL